MTATHGLRKTQEYTAWSCMKDRCYRVKNTAYYNYGGRGIKVCDRWLDSFENFYNDMGKKPEPSYMLDRINNDGDYTPENCRWVSRAVNMLNRRVFANNKTGYRGVSIQKGFTKYEARIRINGIQVHLGSFNTPKEASLIYEKARLKRKVK